MRLRATLSLAIPAAVLGGALYVLFGGMTDPGTAIAGSRTPVVVAQAGTSEADDEAFSDAQRAAIEAIIQAYLAEHPDFIRDFLLENPEVIQDAVVELERRRAEEEAARQAEVLAEQSDVLLYSPRQVVLGNPDGDVTLVEFFDYNCTYCRQSLSDIVQLIADDPDLRLVLKEFPVLGEGSVQAAQVAAVVNMIAPEQYWSFHQLLLGSGVAASTETALAAAEQIGLDPQQIEDNLGDEEVVATIEESYSLADALGINGTPTFVLANEVIVGAVGYDSLRAKIEAVRACGSTVCDS